MSQAIEQQQNNHEEEHDSLHSSRESTMTAFDQDLEQPAEKTKDSLETFSAFSKKTKLLIVVICCFAGIVSPLSANIYFPALDAIQKDLNTTTELVNLTVTVYMIFQGISPSFWGSLADLWGRRPVYLSTLVVYMGSCIGLALAPKFYVLLILRMLQAFGSSSVVAIGAGVVGDIATPSERGGYFGIFSMGQMLGPVIGPVLGGIIAEYLSWRWIFWILLIVGASFFIVIFLFLPETLRSLVNNGSGYANPTPYQWWQRRKAAKKEKESTPTAVIADDDSCSTIIHENKGNQKSRFLQIPNVTQPFLYLLEKDIAVALIYNAIHYATYYCYLTSTPSQFVLIYNMSEIQIGLCFLCQGVGCVLGSFVEGRLLNRDFRIIAKQSGFENTTRGKLPIDFPIFKARLRSVWINAGLIQVITLFYGWMLYIRAPLAVILVLQFIVGFANTSVFNVFQTLAVDLFPGKSATITASNNLVRCLLGAVATVSIEPGIQGVGAGWIFTIIGLICIASNILIPVLLKFGPRWRKARMERVALEMKEQES
ncbi:major facilitator superfamily domain-containing protein [Cokeromyces recurvatus]|uniref:major facilitator superfamily domain-containing protein n=1 Tax=Cokeromyces recurvatus TaxID=90255 RepID=UPI00221F4DC6|nr:major facilitator superfamily domain-containing protein [Cokeromyces recurvatus]KAI7900386.1 major facilitator superfamily domain-containing protein [Cokeromyces recurvatus]